MISTGNVSDKRGDQKERFLDFGKRYFHFLQALEGALSDPCNADVEVKTVIEELLQLKGWPTDTSRTEMATVVLELARIARRVSEYDSTGDEATMASWVSTQEAATMMGVSRQHVADLATRGVLSFRLVGRNRRFDPRAVRDYFANGLKRSTAAAAALAKLDFHDSGTEPLLASQPGQKS